MMSIFESCVSDSEIWNLEDAVFMFEKIPEVVTLEELVAELCEAHSFTLL